MNKIFASLLLISFITSAYSQDQTLKNLKKEISSIENTQKGIKDLHSGLLDVKLQVDDITQKARQHQNDNMLKTYLKGLMDVQNLLSDWPSSAFDMLKAYVENTYIEPYYMKARKVKVDTKKFKIEQNNYTTELNSMYKVFTQMLQYDLQKFDDDIPTSKYTRKYWNTGDGQKDDEAELATRKLNVIIGLGNDLSTEIDKTCKNLRIDYLKCEKIKDDDNRILAMVEKDVQINNMIRKRHQERMQQNNNVQANTSESKKQTYSAREKEDRIANGDEHESYDDVYINNNTKPNLNANVHYTIRDPQKTEVNRFVYFDGHFNSKDIIGDLVWTIDDFAILHLEYSPSNKPTNAFGYTFSQPGIYDVAVTLYYNGQIIDKYTSPITINETDQYRNEYYKQEKLAFNSYSPVINNKPKSISKTQIVNLPYAQYWVSGIKGQEIISGFYYNLKSNKVNYESLKILDYNLSNPAWGLFSLKSLNGYHVYRTMDNNKPTLIICILAQENTKIIHKIAGVTNFEIKISTDYSYANVTYKVGNMNKTITLN